MTRNNTSASAARASHFHRVFAFVLLVFIAHGAIAGAAHNHGNVSATSSANSGLVCTDTNDGNSSSRQLPNGGECLVCQLHRNLYSGLLSPALQISAPVTQTSYTLLAQPRVVSQTNTPQRGRAPPASLS